jgi:hypothetical protein
MFQMFQITDTSRRIGMRDGLGWFPNRAHTSEVELLGYDAESLKSPFLQGFYFIANLIALTRKFRSSASLVPILKAECSDPRTASRFNCGE